MNNKQTQKGKIKILSRVSSGLTSPFGQMCHLCRADAPYRPHVSADNAGKSATALGNFHTIVSWGSCF